VVQGSLGGTSGQSSNEPMEEATEEPMEEPMDFVHFLGRRLNVGPEEAARKLERAVINYQPKRSQHQKRTSK
jgi:hypothetical protein